MCGCVLSIQCLSLASHSVRANAIILLFECVTDELALATCERMRPQVWMGIVYDVTSPGQIDLWESFLMCAIWIVCVTPTPFVYSCTATQCEHAEYKTNNA